MALIQCPECGKTISERAPSCPNCGCPISTNSTSPSSIDKAQEIENYLALAASAIQGENSDLVEKYCHNVLEIDPQNSRAWELEARGLLFDSSLKSNKIVQAIGAAANAVKYSSENKGKLASSLYDCIYEAISILLNIAIFDMPLMHATPYVIQCMNYYGELISGIPGLPAAKIESELKKFEEMDTKARMAFMPKKRLIFDVHGPFNPSWAEQYRTKLKQKGRL